MKSMAGERLRSAQLGWYGIEGDRRFAFRRANENGGNPWLTAGRLRDLLLYQPVAIIDGEPTDIPSHVVTPGGEILKLESDALRQEISQAFRAEVCLFRLNHGIYDEAMLSLINMATIDGIGRLSGHQLDPRRFRPNILLETAHDKPFQEDAWLGKVIAFGNKHDSPAMSVMLRDVRCVMLNLDPETAASTPEILKAVVRTNQNCAGVYGSTLRSGIISEGDGVFLIDI